MNTRAIIVAGAIALTALGTAACSNSETDSTATTTSVSAPAAAANGTGSAAAIAPLDQATAQKDLRALFDPSVPGTEKVTTVEGATAADAAKWDQFAKMAAQGGYTPDVITVKSVTVTGPTATSQVAVASPHAPAPITMPMTWTAQNDVWKLSAASAAQLLAMGQGPSGAGQ
ncbi:DUF4878 domain-containing protein [Rhodococcus sp. D2-41]|uniref:DUF4878 domain-containing protein n=1 Tax=Speluncibacter jeojiensis TaxID=2710754 RepID=A0A9X4LY08_9ACTN|nr:DUF4878 domain-containing protein [Rhodococcus sp. D2-41]MDG3009710.1 DUF4878 domain-containing protein [Rhodococcus sp. D2-41]MDG3014458.1 DUF4878 domain-containing protein [Corynebacteriales bacterium D3-21]